MANKLDQSLTQAFNQQTKVTLIVKNFSPLDNALITEIDDEYITIIAPAYDGLANETQLQRLILKRTQIRGIGFIIARNNASLLEIEDDDLDFF